MRWNDDLRSVNCHGRLQRVYSKAVRLLVITGSMGAGKTTVMAEASDILSAHAVVHAAIDFDALAVGHMIAGASRVDLAYRNLAATWHNFAKAEANALLLAAAVESRSDLEKLQKAVAADSVCICRLRVPIKTMEKRIRTREPGMLQQQFVRRVAVLEALLDAAALEDFSLTNSRRSVTDVARQMLVRAGWLPSL